MADNLVVVLLFFSVMLGVMSMVAVLVDNEKRTIIARFDQNEWRLIAEYAADRNIGIPVVISTFIVLGLEDLIDGA